MTTADMQNDNWTDQGAEASGEVDVGAQASGTGAASGGGVGEIGDEVVELGHEVVHDANDMAREVTTDLALGYGHAFEDGEQALDAALAGDFGTAGSEVYDGVSEIAGGWAGAAGDVAHGVVDLVGDVIEGGQEVGQAIVDNSDEIGELSVNAAGDEPGGDWDSMFGGDEGAESTEEVVVEEVEWAEPEAEEEGWN